jgi:hypothetical protein
MRAALIKRMPRTEIDTTRCIPDSDLNPPDVHDSPPIMG